MLNHRLHALVRSATTATAATRRSAVASRGILATGQQQPASSPTLVVGGTSRKFHSSPPTSLASPSDFHGTTILCVRKNGQVCMMGDGMVSQGSMIIKPNAVKIRQILPKGGPTPSSSDDSESESNDGTVAAQNATLVGFAGTTADAFTLLERLEGKLDEYPGQLSRSCVELAKGWRMDKYLRRLEAALVVADERVTLEITGNGDVLESHDGVISVGSGSPYATGK